MIKHWLKRLWLILQLGWSTLFVQAQLTLKVTGVPLNTPDTAAIFVAGSFNNWNPADVNYLLTNNGDGTYQITLGIPASTISYKFTRGSWQTVESNASGGFQPNHTYTYTGGAAVAANVILGWEDMGGTAPSHTATSNVSIVSNEFYMPQLGRHRRVWIYLPPNYATTTQHYPVLYMQDGQNLFDTYFSFSGEWRVDESMNAMIANGENAAIIVGIDNGGVHRLNEYTPWVHPKYGGGQGAAYMQFIVETLKPYIDAHYRTQPEREHTGIMGSSLGGLISMYGIMQYPEVFSKAGIFSPSFWYSPQCYMQVSDAGESQPMRIYMIAGGNEEPSDDVVIDMFRMRDTLLQSGFAADHLFAVSHPDGQHNEWYWRREFPAAYRWLFANTTANTAEFLNKRGAIKIYPNPTDDTLIIEHADSYNGATVQITDTNGRLVTTFILQRPYIDVSQLAAGRYVVTIAKLGEIVKSQLIYVQ